MECQVSNSKHWDLDIECSAFSIVCQMLVVKYRAVNSKNISDIKYQQLRIDYWILTIRYLLTTRCYAFDIRCRVLCIDYQILNIPTPVYLLLVFILVQMIRITLYWSADLTGHPPLQTPQLVGLGSRKSIDFPWIRHEQN